MSISFYTEGVEYLLRGKGKIRETLLAIAKENNARIANLSYVLVDRKRIRKINVDFLGHNYDTDIITFPYSEGSVVESEVYVCLPVVRENANRFNASTYDELVRVLIHGLLHMVGYDDHSPEDLKEMRAEEDRWLAYFHSL